MKIAKLFAYLIIAIFLPLWLFFLTDSKLKEENKDKNLFRKLNALLKSHNYDEGTNPAMTSTNNHSFIQFTYSPQTTNLTNPQEMGGIPFRFPEYIKLDPASFTGIEGEISSFKAKISSDIQSINNNLTELWIDQKPRDVSYDLASNVFRYEFSEENLPIWIVTKNIKNINDTSILIFKNKSKNFNALLEFDSPELNVISEINSKKITLNPNEEIAVKYNPNNDKFKVCFISVYFDRYNSLGIVPKDTSRITIIVENKIL